jgi:hypothetical protein
VAANKQPLLGQGMEMVLRMSGGSEKYLKTISNIFAGQMESDFNAPSPDGRTGLKFRLIKRATILC